MQAQVAEGVLESVELRRQLHAARAAADPNIVQVCCLCCSSFGFCSRMLGCLYAAPAGLPLIRMHMVVMILRKPGLLCQSRGISMSRPIVIHHIYSPICLLADTRYPSIVPGPERHRHLLSIHWTLVSPAFLQVSMQLSWVFGLLQQAFVGTSKSLLILSNSIIRWTACDFWVKR